MHKEINLELRAASGEVNASGKEVYQILVRCLMRSWTFPGRTCMGRTGTKHRHWLFDLGGIIHKTSEKSSIYTKAMVNSPEPVQPKE